MKTPSLPNAAHGEKDGGAQMKEAFAQTTNAKERSGRCTPFAAIAVGITALTACGNNTEASTPPNDLPPSTTAEAPDVDASASEYNGTA